MSEIEKLMIALNISRDEAEALQQYDKEVNRTTGGLSYDLDDKVAKQALKDAHKGSKEKTVYKFTKRELKENVVKSQIINGLFQFFCKKGYENVEILNKQRQIAFKVGDDNYEITLVQKRKPKT